MSSDLETRLSAALAARVDHPIPIDGLGGSAMLRARTIRRRRRAISTAGVAAVLLAVVAIVRLPPAGLGDNGLPVAAGGGQVGTDPGVLHFALNYDVLDKAVATEWVSSSEGYEKATVYDEDGRWWVTFYLVSDVAVLDRAAGDDRGPAAPSTVDGMPATVREGFYDGAAGFEVRWEPRPGVHAMVLANAYTAEFAVRAAESMRLDRSLRCVMPFRLTELPPGNRWVECQTRVRRAPAAGQARWIHSGMTVEQPDGDLVFIWTTERRDADPQVQETFRADRTVAGRPAQWRTEDPKGLWFAAFGPLDLFVTGLAPEHADRLTEPEATYFAEHLKASDDLHDPSAWPTRAA